MKANLHPYQVVGAKHLYNHRYSGLFWWPGMGKTIVTLLAFVGVQRKRIPGAKLLIVAPLRVALKTWPDEIEKWDETKHLRYVVLHGPNKEARLQQDADVYIINHDGLPWLWSKLPPLTVAGLKQPWPFTGVVFDELTKFKNTNTNRFRDMKKRISRFEFRWGLTGTPAPNSLIELFGQMLVVDGGRRLGEYKGAFLRKYFYEVDMYNWAPVKGAIEQIQKRIGDVMHHLDPKEHLDLPKRIDVRVPVLIPDNVMEAYRSFEAAEVLKVDLDTIDVAHAAALVGKLQQMVQGFLYVDESRAKRLHEAKLDALEEIVESANGEPVFVIYKFREDLAMLKERFPQGVDLNKDVEKRIDDWNARKIPIIFAQPQSAGHGLNMQDGGHIIVWYCLNHSLEQYIQANGRVDRQGQTHPVTVHHLVVEGTVDADIMSTIAARDRTQRTLLAGLKRRVVGDKAA